MDMETQNLFTRLRSFSEKADMLDINGLDVQHAVLCRRRMWLHRKRISFATASEHVKSGLVLSASRNRSDRSANGILGLSPDRIDWSHRVIAEDKSSASHMDASVMQSLFYAALMTYSTGEIWSSEVSIIPTRNKVRSCLDEATVTRLELIADDIEETSRGDIPHATRLTVCNGCSAARLCYGEQEKGNA